MGKLKFELDIDNLNESIFYKRNIFVFKFLTLQTDISQDIHNLCKRIDTYEFLSIVNMLSLFRTSHSISFNEYYNYVSFVVEAISKETNYIFNSLIEKQSLIYSLILKTSDSFTFNDFNLSTEWIDSFSLISVDNYVNLWSLYNIGNYCIDNLSLKSNVSNFIKLFSSVISARNKIDELSEILSITNKNSIIKELKDYEKK